MILLSLDFETTGLDANSDRIIEVGAVLYNHLAKKRSYRWNPERKIWFKVIKELDLESETKQASFDIARVEPIPFHS